MKSFYDTFIRNVAFARAFVGRPLTFSEKILYHHLAPASEPGSASGARKPLRPLEDYACFRPDRVAMQDATAQMALLQFMNAGRDRVSVPTTVHCDHLICAQKGAGIDLPKAMEDNAEVYEFLASASARYGIGFWKPGAGIIHQEVLENYAFPGGMMVGTDSHTPNAGGLGMLAIGVGGADAVDVMTGMDWELKMPAVTGVRLTGSLGPWATPKDVILKLAGILGVKGGTNNIIEYFGPGTDSIPCTGKATICNMGAEVGATCSVFPYDAQMSEYLRATSRGELAAICDAAAPELCADQGSEAFYSRVIEIDLSTLRPQLNGPFTPDAAHEAGKMDKYLKDNNYPSQVLVSLIGSCTNSSYQDLASAAAVAAQALDAGLRPRAELIINPGSEQIRLTAERDGILETLRRAGAVIMANACGPCIGQWKRETADPSARNSIVTSFNRNFAKRADGNPNTHAFIASPQLAVALAFAGRLDFDPASDDIDGFRFTAPQAPALPPEGFVRASDGFVAAGLPVGAGNDGCVGVGDDGNVPEVVIREGSERLQRLEPFPAWDGADFKGMYLLIKAFGKCTTDHISMAGPWLRYRGHLENISENLLMGAVNAFTQEAGKVHNQLTGERVAVSAAARSYRDAGMGSVVVAGENYGEGSSREHAAMEPRFLGVRAVIAKSFARIHETNLKKQGVLALTFSDGADYERVREDDRIDILCSGIAPGVDLKAVLHHADGSQETIVLRHTYNEQQIKWLRAGSALNSLKER